MIRQKPSSFLEAKLAFEERIPSLLLSTTPSPQPASSLRGVRPFDTAAPEHALTAANLLTPFNPVNPRRRPPRRSLAEIRAVMLPRGRRALRQFKINPAGARGVEPPGHLCPEPCVLAEPVATQPVLSLEKQSDGRHRHILQECRRFKPAAASVAG